MTHNAVPIEPAATIVLLKDSDNGPKVLMQQRNPDAAFVGGAWVFPGGKLDPQDQNPSWLDSCDICPDSANSLLQTEEGGHAYWIAAIRETVEEAGILLADQANAALAASAQSYLHANPSGFLEFCQKKELQLDTANLRYLSHWITPQGNPKRYDTRFFLGLWPQGQEPKQDDHEAINTCWIEPELALQRHEANDWLLILPTIMTLRQLCGFASSHDLFNQLGQAPHRQPR